MPTYSIKGPDGRTYSIDGPEGATKEQIVGAITQKMGAMPEQKPAEPSGVMSRLADVGLSAAQGVVGLGEAATGLLDIPTLGRVGRGADVVEKSLFGGTSQDAQKYLESLKSPEAKLAEKNVQEAKGFFPTAKAYLENPSALVGTVAESIPSMFGAAGIARAGLSYAEKLAAKKAGLTLEEMATKKAADALGMTAKEADAAYKASEAKTLLASAAGEGAISGGSTAESIRQQDKEGLLSPTQSLIAGASGALTGALGVFGGKIADKLGVQDIDRLVMGDIRHIGKDEGKKSIIMQAVKGAISESVFEELPQSMQEQIAQNVATGKPWDEGVAEAGASGAMAALVMGGGGAGASTAITNANIKAKAKKDEIVATAKSVKPGESLFEEQDKEDAQTAAGATNIADEAVATAKQQRDNENLQTRFGTTAQVSAEQQREAAHPYGDTMLDEKTGFPLFAGSNEAAPQDQAVVDNLAEANKNLQGTLAALQSAGKDPNVKLGPEDYAKLEEDYQQALVKVKEAREGTKTIQAGFQAPLFAGQQGFDFGAETTDRAQPAANIESEAATGQQGLEFEGDIAESISKVAPKVEGPKFGFTTPTSIAPLTNLLGQIKPRSNSPAESKKQSDAIASIQDMLRSLTEGATGEQAKYYKDVIDTFFDKYAGSDRPSKGPALANLNNLSAPDQQKLLSEYTSLPDLTTYEGAHQLKNALEDHIAEADLAGLGITKASSAYAQMNTVARDLRNKPKSQYDDSDRAAYSYFSTFGLDMALRAAAFDIASKTPRSQLFRGQGKDAAEKFNEWLLLNNTPLEVQRRFNSYVHTYTKKAREYEAFDKMQAAKEKEKEQIGQDVAAEQSDKDATLKLRRRKSLEGGMSERSLLLAGDDIRDSMMMAPLHPAVREHIENNDINGVLKTIASTSASTYQRNLATRLLELNLTTGIAMDAVETLAEDYTTTSRNLISKLSRSLEALMPDIFGANGKLKSKLSLSDVLLGKWDNAATNKERFASASIYLAEIKQIVNRNLASESSIQDIIKDLEDNLSGVNESFEARGVYFPESDRMSISSNNGLNAYVILHEIMHAATANVVANSKLYSSSQQQAVAEMKDLYEFAKLNAKGFSYYGLHDVDEFIAEAFTSAKFQKFLQGIKYKYSNKSMWDKFVDYCLKLFGADNLLSSTMATTNAIFGVPAQGNYIGTAPPLFAKRNKGMFESNSNERSRPTEILNGLIKGAKSWDSIKGNMAKMLATMNTQTRKHWLGAFTLRQIEEMVGKIYSRDQETGEMGFFSKVPALAKYLTLTDEMINKRSKILHTATTISHKLQDLQMNSPATMQHLTACIQYNTVNEVDPEKGPPVPKDPSKLTDDDKAKAKAYPVAKQMWDQLGTMKEGDKAKGLYVEARQFFVDRLESFKTIALEAEYQRQLDSAKLDPKDPDLNAKEAAIRQAAETKVNSEFSDKIDPYFPLKRFGEFWVRVGTGAKRKYMQFEDAVAKNAYLDKELAKYEKQLRAKGATDEHVKAELASGVHINDGNSLPDLSKDLFSDKDTFDKVKKIVLEGGKTVSDTEELRKLIEDEIGQLYITTMPLQSIRRMFLHRENVAGASADLIRSFQHAAMHMAYQHARFEYSPKLDISLEAAKNTINVIRQTDREEATVLRDYLNEISSRHKNALRNPVEPSKLANIAGSANFLWYLTAPASAVVNMLAIPSIALPVLGGKFGTVKSWKTMVKYMKMLSGSGWKNPETGAFDTPSIGRSKDLTELQRKAYEAFSEGIFEQSLAHDAASLAENPSLNYSGHWGKIMEIATFPFHKAERFNREITAMASFELAYAKNGGNFDAAIKEATDLTYKTMFDYNTYNKPRYMQGNLSKILFAFKQYPQHFTYLMFRTAFEATKNVSQEEKAEVAKDYGPAAADAYEKSTNELRAEARKTFMLLMGMSFLFAGAAGLPIWWMYTGIAKAFHAMYDEPDEHHDVENEFKNKMSDVFGGFVGDSISRGVIPQLTGLSLSDRMSTNLPDMWFRDTKQNQDEVAYVQNMMINLLGPTAGLVVNGAEAVKRFNDGNTERAFESLAPAAFKNILAGTRLAREGALTMKGDTLLENVSGMEAFNQMLGFTPERLAQRQSANIEAKGIEQYAVTRRQDLLNFYAMALDNGDDDAQANVLAKMIDFNQANPWLPISPTNIIGSLKKRNQIRAQSNMLGGVRVNKKFIPEAMDLTEYGSQPDEE